MTNPLHAAYYADQAFQRIATVAEREKLARDTYRVRLEVPEIARRILPGQFVMVRMPNCEDPLLGRALALYDVVIDQRGEPHAIDLVFLVVGKMTGRLAECAPGQTIELWGPLGNGFEPRDAKHLVMVAGGIGQTPFVAMAKECLAKQRYGEPHRDVAAVEKVTFCYGARTADYLAGLADFEAAGCDVRISTDDGTAGHHGLVTEVLSQVLDDEEDVSQVRVVCCGPEPMMEAVAELCLAREVACEVSLETPMACGIGICFSCVTKVRDEDGWDYKRTCVEGPVFDAGKIVWE
ncbi:MAG: dihydroorotate dehydrogenase electron transfer subunit [Pirellulales bacterium]|nr:dihydroorotate dehydrogenase electron transfer subunit [Pirellulales bacterium]